MFRQQSDVEVQIRASFAFFTQTVLTDKHECGKKNCLQRYNHGQKSVWKWVKNMHAELSSVEQNPNPKPQDMHINENHPSRNGCDHIGDAALYAAFTRSFCTEMNYRP